MMKALRFRLIPTARNHLADSITVAWGLLFLFGVYSILRRGLSFPMIALMSGALLNIVFLFRSRRGRRVFQNPYKNAEGKYLPPPAKEGWED
ncbi:hypothetical protein RYH73_06005 [Olivibacter sp. CPCC 100613]|uniref:hypothetical protein n=1 Tax=Olivibacter sp. CPCC 100613 TaxID=3079931 RepID=UPI002FF540C2